VEYLIEVRYYLIGSKKKKIKDFRATKLGGQRETIGQKFDGLAETANIRIITNYS
jgi:hypothetical protein